MWATDSSPRVRDCVTAARPSSPGIRIRGPPHPSTSTACEGLNEAREQRRRMDLQPFHGAPSRGASPVGPDDGSTPPGRKPRTNRTPEVSGRLHWSPRTAKQRHRRTAPSTPQTASAHRTHSAKRLRAEHRSLDRPVPTIRSPLFRKPPRPQHAQGATPKTRSPAFAADGQTRWMLWPPPQPSPLPVETPSGCSPSPSPPKHTPTRDLEKDPSATRDRGLRFPSAHATNDAHERRFSSAL